MIFVSVIARVYAGARPQHAKSTAKLLGIIFYCIGCER
jgi:hypothetical protein